MSYNSVALNAMSKKLFPGAAGYGGSVTVGQLARARQAATGQTARNAAQAKRLAQPMFPGATGYGGSITMGDAIGKRRPPMVGGGSRAVGVRNPRTTRAPIQSVHSAPLQRTTPVQMGPTQNRPAAPSVEQAKGNAGFNRRTLMGIGLGMGVAAGVAMNRRGEGASSGRQSIYKY